MILVNIPMIAAWALLAYASNIEMIVTGILLLGLSVGLMEAPIITYVGEIWQVFISFYECLYVFIFKINISASHLYVVHL